MTLTVAWDGKPVGVLERTSPTSREYAFRYTDDTRALSLALPTSTTAFSPAQTRPFFEALLPEGTLRERLASQFKLASSDSYGLLAVLGRDCAGAIQVYETKRMSDPPGVRWLDEGELDALIRDLPNRPLGVSAGDDRVRLSLAGVQRKAVLVRDADGRYGEPLNGRPSTHILKPQAPESEYPSIAVNEYFCMRLAAMSGLMTAKVVLPTLAGLPCLVVERFDRDLTVEPVRRLHQEDLCQALGITPDFKYQHEDWAVPSFKALGALLNERGERPGVDRLAVAEHAIFNVLVGNSDAHAKNLSFLHAPDGRVRVSPWYDLLSTAVYPALNHDLALSIGDEYDADRLGFTEWADLAYDLDLGASAFVRRRVRLAERIQSSAVALRAEARSAGWHEPLLDDIVELVERRGRKLVDDATGPIASRTTS